MIAFMKRYLGFFLLMIGVIGLVVSNLITLDAQAPQSTLIETDYQDSGEAQKQIFVDIKGEVTNPGVYQVDSSNRVGDVIALAGGVTDFADLTDVNLAQTVTDQMILFIPSCAVISSQPTQMNIFVDIKGEVAYPGLYSVPDTFRIFDVIARAGGLTAHADTSSINLSSLVQDQMILIIPSSLDDIESTTPLTRTFVTLEIKGEVVNPGLYSVESTLYIKDVINLAGGITEDADISSINLNQCIVKNMSIVIPKKTTSLPNEITTETVVDGNLININTAMVDELDTLPGIGYIIAQRIIDYRAEYGPFESIEDIMNVSGIKESIYEQLKDLICI